MCTTIAVWKLLIILFVEFKGSHAVIIFLSSSKAAMRCPRCAWVRLLFVAARKDGSRKGWQFLE
jgi:hypothetical protein